MMSNDDDIEESTQECAYHKPLHIDCDGYTVLWNAIEDIRKQYIEWEADKEELDMLDAMQKELDIGVMDTKKCWHVYEDELLLSMPPKQRCIKCGHLEVV